MTETHDRIAKLWPHLVDMTEDELREHIVKIRTERRRLKMKTPAVKSARQASDTAKARMRKLLGDVDPATMAKMLKDLEP